jgi:hypothetical protein
MRLTVFLLVLVFASGCGGGAAPTAPENVAPPASSLPPTAALSCLIDGRLEPERAYAVMATSQVIFDATGSKGDAAKYVIDYGDGLRETLTESTLRSSHVFMSSGSYVVDITVTDRYRRVAAVSKTVVVKAFEGYWDTLLWNKQLGRLELHSLAFDRQTGTSITGRYMTPDGRVWGASGSLIPDRWVFFKADNGVAFQGTVPFKYERDGFPFMIESEMGATWTWYIWNPTSPW